jgi:hypothetical protein
MMEELKGMTEVIENIKVAIDQDCTQKLGILFATYGQYAQILSTAGNHRFLQSKELSLLTINLKLRQRLIQQNSGDKPRLCESTVKMLLGQVPIDNQLALAVMKAYPDSTSIIARDAFLNPYWLANCFDNSNSTVEEVLSLLVANEPDLGQGILTRVFEVIPTHLVGIQFVRCFLSSLPALGALDSELRAVVSDRQSLLLDTLMLIAERASPEVATPAVLAKVHDLGTPELTKALINIDHLPEFGERQQAELHLLIHKDLPFTPESLNHCIAFDQRKTGAKASSFVTALFMCSSVLSLHELSDAMAETWRGSPSKLLTTLWLVANSIAVLKTQGLYDERRACALVEDLYLQTSEIIQDANKAADAFVKVLPEDLIKASGLIEHPEIALEMLQTDLGL